MSVDPQNALYEKVTPEDALELVQTLKGGAPSLKRGDLNHPFFKKQMSIVLANSGEIDPERIEAYIAADGYQALHRCAARNDAEGSGGGHGQERFARARRRGFPHRHQMGHGRQDPKRRRNTSSATPTRATPARSWTAAFWKAIPHSVLEGMAIAAYAVGANQGFIYVRAEYPLAIKRLQTAIKQAKTTWPARQRHF